MLVRENFVIATEKKWNIDNFYKFYGKEDNWYLVESKEEFLTGFNHLKPKYIFFPHWSWIIPKELYENYNCVVFHMTDLPYGRGPEPLQHLILRGNTDTVISAIKVSEGMDTGPVYVKFPLSLYGTAEEIYNRCSNTIFEEMIPNIITMDSTPKPQVGCVVNFNKRTVEDCRIPNAIGLNDAYNFIRANDADSYPPAFIETGTLRFEFTRASLKHNEIIADVSITQKRQTMEDVGIVIE